MITEGDANVDTKSANLKRRNGKTQITEIALLEIVGILRCNVQRRDLGAVTEADVVELQDPCHSGMLLGLGPAAVLQLGEVEFGEHTRDQRGADVTFRHSESVVERLRGDTILDAAVCDVRPVTTDGRNRDVQRVVELGEWFCVESSGIKGTDDFEPERARGVPHRIQLGGAVALVQEQLDHFGEGI